MTTVILTGGAGFAGSHIADEIIATTDWNIVVLDALTYAGRLDRLAHLPPKRVKVVHHDLGHTLKGVFLNVRRGDDVVVIHNGAETHVRRSLEDPTPFIHSNLIGTQNILGAAKYLRVKKFIYVSTDEVYGSAAHGQVFQESDSLAPSNPYAATKAGGEMIALSYFRSYGLPVVISRTANMLGERQNCEKFVPMTIRKLLNSEPVEIHMAPWGAPGARQWLHARNQASALVHLLDCGVPGEAYNLPGDELSNDEMARAIAAFLGRRPLFRYVNIYDKYLAHDLRYDIDGSKLKALGWAPPRALPLALAETVKWYEANPQWLEE